MSPKDRPRAARRSPPAQGGGRGSLAGHRDEGYNRADGRRSEWMVTAHQVKLDRLKAARFSCEVDGSGDVLLAGAVTNQRIVLSGSGRLPGSDLKSQTDLYDQRLAEVELWVEHKLRRADLRAAVTFGITGHRR